MMEDLSQVVLSVASGLVGALIAVFSNSVLQKRAYRKELMAKAIASVLKRVELYYRIRRRVGTEADYICIRDKLHDIQEENEYYKSLMLIEAHWYGVRFSKYLDAIKKLTGSAMREAWNIDPLEIGADMVSSLSEEKIHSLTEQFIKDSRRFNCLLTRLWMMLHDQFRKTKKYDIS